GLAVAVEMDGHAGPDVVEVDIEVAGEAVRLRLVVARPGGIPCDSATDSCLVALARYRTRVVQVVEVALRGALAVGNDALGADRVLLDHRRALRRIFLSDQESDRDAGGNGMSL